MLAGLIRWSLSNRALVVALFFLMAAGGLYAATRIPVDAVPDLVNVQVQVVTESGTLSPLEVERYVTYPVELAVSGLPGVEEVRHSTSDHHHLSVSVGLLWLPAPEL